MNCLIHPRDIGILDDRACFLADEPDLTCDQLIIKSARSVSEIAEYRYHLAVRFKLLYLVIILYYRIYASRSDRRSEENYKHMIKRCQFSSHENSYQKEDSSEYCACKACYRSGILYKFFFLIFHFKNSPHNYCIATSFLSRRPLSEKARHRFFRLFSGCRELAELFHFC